MREIDRYERASTREQILDALGWFRSHRIVGTLLILLALGWVAQLVMPPKPTTPAALSVGDCLYARTSAWMDTGPDARPIGTSNDVEAIVMAGNAERAACGASHGHEVSAVVSLPSAGEESSGPAAASPSGAAGSDPVEAMRPSVQARCDAAFEGYVGTAASASVYETFAALPTLSEWQAGEHLAICLVARKDGHWMASPARASRE